jgi:hypothetical protein
VISPNTAKRKAGSFATGPSSASEAKPSEIGGEGLGFTFCRDEGEDTELTPCDCTYLSDTLKRNLFQRFRLLRLYPFWGALALINAVAHIKVLAGVVPWASVATTQHQSP